MGDLHTDMREIGRRAREAACILAFADTDAKNRALIAGAAAIRASANALIAANARDLDEAKRDNLTDAMIDRLTLDQKRVAAMAQGLEDVAALPDPVGAVMAEWTRPNGLTCYYCLVE